MFASKRLYSVLAVVMTAAILLAACAPAAQPPAPVKTEAPAAPVQTEAPVAPAKTEAPAAPAQHEGEHGRLPGARARRGERHTDADAQAGKRAGTLGVDNGVDVGQGDSGFGQQGVQDGQNQCRLAVAYGFINAVVAPVVMHAQRQMGAAGVDGQ